VCAAADACRPIGRHRPHWSAAAMHLLGIAAVLRRNCILHCTRNRAPLAAFGAQLHRATHNMHSCAVGRGVPLRPGRTMPRCAALLCRLCYDGDWADGKCRHGRRHRSRTSVLALSSTVMRSAAL
jgi:hypothetical protein